MLLYSHQQQATKKLQADIQAQAQEELDADTVAYENSPLEIGFQARYLTDITAQIGEKVEFLFADGAAPTIVKDEAKPEALYVLMPMRV